MRVWRAVRRIPSSCFSISFFFKICIYLSILLFIIYIFLHLFFIRSFTLLLFLCYLLFSCSPPVLSPFPSVFYFYFFPSSFFSSSFTFTLSLIFFFPLFCFFFMFFFFYVLFSSFSSHHYHDHYHLPFILLLLPLLLLSERLPLSSKCQRIPKWSVRGNGLGQILHQQALTPCLLLYLTCCIN